MVNIVKCLPRHTAKGLLWSLPIILSLVSPAVVFAKEVKYKKQTVVDFEDALVEGKSRKPYSAYLSQQKNTHSADLSQWDFDLKQKETQLRSKVGLKP